MLVELPVRCRCGALQGTAALSADTVTRLLCYCDDCQAYAHWLGADDVLDPHGGTDIGQMSPAALQFTEGVENLAALRLSGNGMVRWYAACCKTPIGNTLASGPPFVGLIGVCVDHSEHDREALLGPVNKAQGRFATHPVPDAPDRPPLRFMLMAGRRMLGWWWRGDGKRAPWPTVDPRILSVEEREALPA